MRVLVESKDEFWPRWTPTAWQNADDATLAHVCQLKLWQMPRRHSNIPDLMTYLLGNLESLDPTYQDRIESLLRPDLSQYVYSLFSLEHGSSDAAGIS